MNANRYFSFSRLALVMKRDFMENWKTNLYRFLGPYTIFLLVMWFSSMNMTNFNEFSDIVSATFFSVLFFGGSFTASYALETMNTQQKRISFLMLPATSFEKFFARFLYVTVGFVVLSTIALLLAEVTRFLLLPMFDLPDTFKQSTLPNVWQTIMNVRTFNFNGSGIMESVVGWLFLIWIHSFFLLGGCRWYKNAFWKTLGLIILVNFFFIFVSVNLVESLDEGVMEEILLWCEANFSWVTVTGILSFAIVMFMLLILLNWWLSYRCFTRSQVIKPKFRLL
jgi:hypothetical protein